ncbi:MAG: Arylsulfatase [Phycisphaerae bacterium]|nr:Arylsulfatase [Phycisphaerae bacterium]
MAGNMTRRDLLKLAGAGAAALMLPDWLRGDGLAAAGKRPNLLLIVTDQQNLTAMSAAGNKWVKTPNMDRLADRGLRFEKSYCTYPLCGPARASLFTSRMPHEVGVEANDASSIPAGMPTLGELLRQAGYETAYAGKWHIPEVYPGYGRDGKIPGFDVLPLPGRPAKFGNGPSCGLKIDVDVTDAAVRFLNAKHDRPFALVVSILNPHDICGLPRNQAEFARLVGPGDPLPPLPDNFNATDGEPWVLQRSRQNGWTDEEWRRYRGVYYRLVEAADKHVGRMMDALAASGRADSTVVLFTSDHGEMMGAHHQTVKLKLYEESAAVPLIACVPGVTGKAAVDSTHLVSGLDILPTLCDYAGVKVPDACEGRSLRPVIEGRAGAWRDYVVAEVVAGKAAGRMVRSSRYKYVIYDTGDGPEQLFDLQADPGETKNLATDPAAAESMAAHRRMLAEWAARTKDPFKAGQSAPASQPAGAGS